MSINSLDNTGTHDHDITTSFSNRGTFSRNAGALTVSQQYTGASNFINFMAKNLVNQIIPPTNKISKVFHFFLLFSAFLFAFYIFLSYANADITTGLVGYWKFDPVK